MVEPGRRVMVEPGGRVMVEPGGRDARHQCRRFLNALPQFDGEF